VVAMTTITASAQNQLKVMMEQILKMKIQTGLQKEGNKNANNGLSRIGTNKNGTYTVFKNYFTSLKNVNPKVKKTDEVEKIRDLFFEIRRIFPLTIDMANNSGLFEFHEIQYFDKVYDKVQKDCQDILSNLNTVTSNGTTEMTDDQRIKRIQQLYTRMVEAYTFSKGFCTDIQCTKASRQKAKYDVQMMHKLYGSNNLKK
jgi:hypothetical protein